MTLRQSEEKRREEKGRDSPGHELRLRNALRWRDVHEWMAFGESRCCEFIWEWESGRVEGWKR